MMDREEGGGSNTQRLNEFEEHVCSGNQELKK